MVTRVLSILDPQHFVFVVENIVKADYLIDDNPRQLEILLVHRLCLQQCIILMMIDLNA